MSNRQSACALIAETQGPRGVLEAPTTTERIVCCTVRSVGMREVYEAMSHDLHPEIVLELADYAEWQRERRVLFEGVYYRVLRTYINSHNGIELTLEREAGQ